MLLADVQVVVVWLGLWLAGVVGIFVMLLMLAAQAVTAARRGFSILFGAPTENREPRRMRQCGNSRCQYLNVPAARYCGRCGTPLPPTGGINAYG